MKDKLSLRLPHFLLLIVIPSSFCANSFSHAGADTLKVSFGIGFVFDSAVVGVFLQSHLLGFCTVLEDEVDDDNGDDDEDSGGNAADVFEDTVEEGVGVGDDIDEVVAEVGADTFEEDVEDGNDDDEEFDDGKEAVAELEVVDDKAGLVLFVVIGVDVEVDLEVDEDEEALGMGEMIREEAESDNEGGPMDGGKVIVARPRVGEPTVVETTFVVVIGVID